jgi:hypothetical protein
MRITLLPYNRWSLGLLGILFCMVLHIVLLHESRAQDNPVFDLLIQHGVGADSNPELRLPLPTLQDHASKDVHQKILESLPARKQSIEELMSAKTVAPFVYQHSYRGDEDADTRLQAIDIWFVAAGKIDQVYNENFAIQLFQENHDVNKPRLLGAEELRHRGIEEIKTNESYGRGRGMILEKIVVEAVSRVCVSKTDESVIIAGMIEPRFNLDGEIPNRWYKTSNEAGIDVSASSAYQKAGYYTKITTFQADSKLLFVESHSIFEEPRAWFNGSPTLKSKLPIVFQSEIRSFRRRLLEK